MSFQCQYRVFPLWPSRLLHKFSICSTSPMSCRGGYCPRLQANKLDGQRLKTLDATNLPFSNVRYKQRFFAREHYILYLSKIFSPLGQYSPLQPWRVHYLLISRPKKTMAQCRVSPRARVSACPGTMLHHTKSPDRWWAENRLRTRLQATDILLLRMLKQYLHLKLKMSFRGNWTNIFIMQENILEIFFN